MFFCFDDLPIENRDFMGFSSSQSVQLPEGNLQELAELTPEDGPGLGLPGKPLVIASGNLTWL